MSAVEPGLPGPGVPQARDLPGTPERDAATAELAGAVVIGAGPAGLMAAEVLAAGGTRVDVYDAMPSVGRKFLLAGRGGLNLTHGEPFTSFAARFGPASVALAPVLRAFQPQAVRDWAQGLGITTFVGSSGRVFPQDLKAAPLLRAWLHRLRAAGVTFHARHRWQGWSADGALRFDSPGGPLQLRPGVTILALGGGSWSRLGSDGAWVPWLQSRGVEVAPLRPSNCGFDVGVTPASGSGLPGWSEHLRLRHAGQPIKPVAASLAPPVAPAAGKADRHWTQGEFVITSSGVEGSLVYTFSATLRDAIERDGHVTWWLDLLPAHEAARVAREVAHPRGPRSLATHLKSRLGLQGAKLALLHELLPRATLADPVALAAAIKSLPLPLVRTRPLDEAISSAGGVRFDAVDDHGMLLAVPGVFCAGEMLDWEAPTGGYLLTASLASGRRAGQGASRWLGRA